MPQRNQAPAGKQYGSAIHLFGHSRLGWNAMQRFAKILAIFFLATPFLTAFQQQIPTTPELAKGPHHNDERDTNAALTKAGYPRRTARPTRWDDSPLARTQQASATFSRIHAPTKHPVFLIMSAQPGGSHSTGTAFLVWVHGLAWLVTANHVVNAPASSKVFVLIDGHWRSVRPANHDDSVDLAVFIPPLEFLHRYSPFTIRTSLARNGEKIRVIGFPLPELIGSRHYTIIDGTVIHGKVDPRGIPGFWFNAPISEGNSGSPVVDINTRVIGVVLLKYPTDPRGYAVHAIFLEKVLGRWGR